MIEAIQRIRQATASSASSALLLPENTSEQTYTFLSHKNTGCESMSTNADYFLLKNKSKSENNAARSELKLSKADSPITTRVATCKQSPVGYPLVALPQWRLTIRYAVARLSGYYPRTAQHTLERMAK
jgi:hypothetical protein